MGTEARQLTSGEVARTLHISPRTVIRWAREGRLPSTVTATGERRFQQADIDAVLLRPALPPEDSEA